MPTLATSRHLLVGKNMSNPSLTSALRAVFGKRLREGELLGRYTSSRIGGPADYFISVETTNDLANAIKQARHFSLTHFILGAGSNILVSDWGYRGLVIQNRAREVSIIEEGDHFVVRAESGAGLPTLARQCMLRGAAGLEWAATVPGTVGGAVFGNAGAHGSEVAATIRMATILQSNNEVRQWSNAELQFAYRTSAIKRGATGIILAAEFELKRDTPKALQEKLEGYIAHRKRTQPPGASIGSMFKNPPGDHAGRLIEAAGLKGLMIGKAEISPIHANFFVNLGNAKAHDVYSLIALAQTKVREKFGVNLELEIELVGEWGGQC
jgi:UDP-N-acetylmuramate dehydrogenase